jgi:hypothetical protein
LPGGPRLAVRSPLFLALVLLVALGSLAVGVLFLVGPDVVGLSIFSIIIAPTMAVVLTALAAARTAWRERSQSLRDSMGFRRLCAACGYDLSSHEPERDGCTVCPECSAAWRLASEADGPRVVVVPRDF